MSELITLSFSYKTNILKDLHRLNKVIKNIKICLIRKCIPFGISQPNYNLYKYNFTKSIVEQKLDYVKNKFMHII